MNSAVYACAYYPEIYKNKLYIFYNDKFGSTKTLLANINHENMYRLPIDMKENIQNTKSFINICSTCKSASNCILQKIGKLKIEQIESKIKKAG
ncbi:hypothetical protein DEFDS_P227 (plasmid) [Deferribacter desulfuricans SSM1]|uniref:Uncharacterized protein n=1 Tax=Deferribacter desulfuricans (strain DSM 14783 / JCM 11476 / NBRC 101012 / SSM1) TaxID=639282 RepID=D3PF55_DEFDS|nr:hypothetical protein [Deferribacter desulfuricans]BAI81847.1 hypothetical protein DEFDS_P227 [Deferribacter desulfuricans SSM1]